MPDHKRRQRDLFGEVDASHLPPMDEALQQTVTQLLALWLQALAKTVEAEVSDEQDQR
jgi:hypothetical protein